MKWCLMIARWSQSYLITVTGWSWNQYMKCLQWCINIFSFALIDLIHNHLYYWFIFNKLIPLLFLLRIKMKVFWTLLYMAIIITLLKFWHWNTMLIWISIYIRHMCRHYFVWSNTFLPGHHIWSETKWY